MQNQSNNFKTQDEWETIVSEWKNSGISQAKFCKNNNIPHSTFSFWKKRFLGVKTQTIKSKAFIPITQEITPQENALSIALPNGISIKDIHPNNINTVKLLLETCL